MSAVKTKDYWELDEVSDATGISVAGLRRRITLRRVKAKDFAPEGMTYKRLRIPIGEVERLLADKQAGKPI